ncbi:MAG: methyltransferase domain-containing protein [Myxococcales bacterium]|nr:methyltransferase domain-containing protein [Myxococcales bacterium]
MSASQSGPGLEIEPAGGDTATPLNLRKRVAAITAWVGPFEGRRFLDCGCGAGEYVRAFEALGARAAGVEIEAAKLRDAGVRGSARGLSRGDIQRLPFADATFDLALVNEVLEHVPDDLAGLREVHRVLLPGGRVVVLSPNRLYPFETHGVFLRGSGRRLSHATPFVPWLPVSVGRRFLRYWARNYWPWELERRVREAGFEVVERGFLWQTFESISGQQPAWMRSLRVSLRALAGVLEAVPVLRAFGVSQAIVARRPHA